MLGSLLQYDVYQMFHLQPAGWREGDIEYERDMNDYQATTSTLIVIKTPKQLVFFEDKWKVSEG